MRVDKIKRILLTYSGTIYSKKNSKRIVTDSRSGKPRIISNQNAKDQEIEMLWNFRGQIKGQEWEIFDKDPDNYLGRYFSIGVVVYQPDARKRDLDNQLTAILDGLVGANIIPDDGNKFVVHLHIDDGGIDRENPRAEITVEEITYSEEQSIAL